MDAIIKASLNRSMSYQAYRDLVSRLANNHGTTGAEKTETFINFTKLNDRRMHRWDKTLKIDAAAKHKIQAFDHNIIWLVLVESWCGDGAHVLPAFHKIAECNPHIDLRIVLRDDNPELMTCFLTNGSRSIPKLIMLDAESKRVLETYGPRPSEATGYVNRYLAKYGKLSPEFKEDLQYWYNDDKGQNVIRDLTAMLCRLEPSVCL